MSNLLFFSFDHLGDIDDDTGPHDHQPAERAGADLGEVLLVISTLEQAFLKEIMILILSSEKYSSKHFFSHLDQLVAAFHKVWGCWSKLGKVKIYV